MNGNYLSIRYMAEAKQREMDNLAKKQLLARQAGSRNENQPLSPIIRLAGAQLRQTFRLAAKRVGGYRSNWKGHLRWPGAATT